MQIGQKQGQMTDFSHAEIPTRLTGLRACLRCALIKEFSQVSFHNQ